MVRKLVKRLLFLSVALVAAVTLTAGIAVYYALQTPDFYAELRGQEFSKGEQKAAELTVRAMEKNFKQWTAQSLQRQRKPAGDAQEMLGGLLQGAQGEYDPKQDTHQVLLTQQQLNVLLASSASSGRGEWQNPRVRIRQDHLDFAMEVVTPKLTCTLSVDLKPSLQTENNLRLELIAARIGQLTLPVSTITGWLPRELRLSKQNNVELDLTGTTPQLVVDLSEDHPQSPTVRSLVCSEGELTITFAAPVLKPQVEETGEAPLALSQVK